MAFLPVNARTSCFSSSVVSSCSVLYMKTMFQIRAGEYKTEFDIMDIIHRRVLFFQGNRTLKRRNVEH